MASTHRRLFGCAAIASLGVLLPAAAAGAQCRRDELRVVLPPRVEGAPTASVEVARSGRDPFDGPAGGTCVVQDASVTHVPDGERRSFDVTGSTERLIPIEVGREIVHVSLPPGASVRFASSACQAWSLEGEGLDVFDHAGEPPGPGPAARVQFAPTLTQWRAPYFGACTTDGELALTPGMNGFGSCHDVPQRGLCQRLRARYRGRVHSFFLRTGEHWRIEIGRRELTSRRLQT